MPEPLLTFTQLQPVIVSAFFDPRREDTDPESAQEPIAEAVARAQMRADADWLEKQARQYLDLAAQFPDETGLFARATALREAAAAFRQAAEEPR